MKHAPTGNNLIFRGIGVAAPFLKGGFNLVMHDHKQRWRHERFLAKSLVIRARGF
jgi:hypothetical protein